jgi:hypothetical protein
VAAITAAYLDEQSGLWLSTGLGPAALADQDGDWALERLKVRGRAVDDAALAEALALPSGAATALVLHVGSQRLPVTRLDSAEAPRTLGFVREPQPLPGERASR